MILHNAVSLDGWLDGFPIDVGLYYETAGQIGADAILSGSSTILAAFAESYEDPPGEAAPPPEPDTRPLLAVVDSRGRVTQWRQLIAAGFWRGVLRLCSETTPQEHRRVAQAAGVETLVAGRERVDLGRGLQMLRERFGVDTVRTDSGGILNMALLRQGLLDEVSLLFHPVFAGPGKLPLLARTEMAPPPAPTQLEITSIENLRGGILWLRARLAARLAAHP
ncbi:MAG TPA: dihydrofolate reductase family protein [Anaerolineales bacterium]|nr:dihydrofolate reductase family protein [Anaerolineales bacterium]